MCSFFRIGLNRKFNLFACVLLALGLFLSACSKQDTDGNLMVFHYVQQDDVKTWDPANAYDSISLGVLPAIAETLYQYAYLKETYTVVPLLAADMPKFSADRLTVTISMKKGIKFQDDPCFKETGGKGREVKAQDFIYEMKRLALPALQSQGWWILDGRLAGVNEFHDKLVKADKASLPKIFAEEIPGMKALDDYTIQLKLTKPYPQLLYILSMTFTAAVPHEAVEAYADESGNLTDHPVGSGAFILKTWERGRAIVMDRNPNFHTEFYPTEASEIYRKQGMLADAGKQLPFLDRVSITVVKEDQPRWLNYMKGNIDLFELPKTSFSQAMTSHTEMAPELKAKGAQLSIEVGVVFYYISFNMKDKLLGSNKYLRQALSSAINREKWLSTFTSDTGQKMTSALPPGIPDRPENAKIKYDFDLAKAKELLKKAGYPDGKGLPTLNFDQRGADSVSRQLNEFFAEQFAQIGVKVNPILNTFPAYLEKAKQGNLQISYGAWSMDYPDPENNYQLLYGPNKAPGPNEANYDNPEMNKLYDEMAVMEPGPKRAKVVQKAEDILQEEVPWAMGYYLADYWIYQPWLQNFRSGVIINNPYKYYRVNRETKKRYLEAK